MSRELLQSFPDVWSPSDRAGALQLLAVTDALPFVRAPFEKLALPVPARSAAHLEACYGPRWAEECVSPSWSHRSERPIAGPLVRASREELAPYYRFIV